MGRALNIFIGGVPFGRNNVGDEAILECTVGIVRKICPDAMIVVSTDDQRHTAERLKVDTVPLFGFAPPYSKRQMRRCIAEADVFVWAGATGLSDYPEIPLSMLEIAHHAGTKTVVWGVGMNRELNPFLYQVLPGRRRAMLELLSRLAFGKINLVKRVEEIGKARACHKIVAQLERADLVVLRDPETLTAIHACGEIHNAVVGADSAELLEPVPWHEVSLEPDARTILESDHRKIGLCVSAQRQLVHEQELIDFLDRLAKRDYRIVFLPMNHETDAPLMMGLLDRMEHKAHAVVIKGRHSPGEILSIAGCLDLVISSRLHLLILASILHVPIIGISRGTKVDNFLAPFGHVTAGSVDECDFDHMQSELDRLIDSRQEFEEVSLAVREMLLERMDHAIGLLAGLLDSIDTSRRR